MLIRYPPPPAGQQSIIKDILKCKKSEKKSKVKNSINDSSRYYENKRFYIKAIKNHKG